MYGPHLSALEKTNRKMNSLNVQRLGSEVWVVLPEVYTEALVDRTDAGMASAQSATLVLDAL